MSGSGGGIGYGYQASATAYVAVHILAEENLRWIEDSNPDVPISVAGETGGAGDDLCITLRSGIKIELQAKHGLKKDKLWEPLIKLGKGLQADPDLYGVILIDSDASKIIREDLRNDFKRLGENRVDNLKAITKEMQQKFLDANLPDIDPEFFRRLVIIVLDLDEGLQDDKQAQLLLSLILHDRSQSTVAWKILCQEGLQLIKICGCRNLQEWERFLNSHGVKLASDRVKLNIDELCKEASKRSYRYLTTNENPLMAEIGLTADQSNVVSLEIVERKQISKKREDIQSSEQGSSFYQPTENEEGERFPTTDKFLDEVVRDRKTKNSQGLRIAITGEAGAGKTTLLQRIGIYLESLNNDLVPIWISLKQVTKNIDAYLEDEYLKEVTRKSSSLKISDQYLQSLNDLLNSGRVVLLLDGADESNEQNILGNLREQLKKPLFDNVQVILTCRINTWDILWQSAFDVYRIIPFTYPDQVENFIDHFSWGDGENLAGSLKEVLSGDSKSKLRDMITNPLRLYLLCYLWKNEEESLPDTRAELYKKMLRAFYIQNENELNNRKFGEPSKKLEEFLGKLALNALDQDNYKYLILESDIEKILDDLDDESDLFWQATKKFGLLNYVGKSSKRPTESVYAFWHPTFQEYFAAFYISQKESCEFFLQSHIIFKTQWIEPISIWLEMEEVDTFQKQHLTNNLLCFEECGGFYQEEANKLCRVLSINIPKKSITIPAGQSITLNLDLFTMQLTNSHFIEDTNPIINFLHKFDGEFDWNGFKIKPNDAISINNILKALSPYEREDFHQMSIRELIEISEANETEFEEITSQELISISKIDYSRAITYITMYIFWNLIANRNNPTKIKLFTKDLIYLIKTKTSNLISCCLTRKLSAHLLIRFLIDEIPTKEISKLIVAELGRYTTRESYADDNILYKWSREVVSRCIDTLTYEECYKAWHSQIHSTFIS